MENELLKPVLTQEQIERTVLSAFDSVNLVNELNALESLDEEQTACKDRNVEHLNIMMAYDWFVDALTEEQKTEINKIIK
jgi:hypothetical protein